MLGTKFKIIDGAIQFGIKTLTYIIHTRTIEGAIWQSSSIEDNIVWWILV